MNELIASEAQEYLIIKSEEGEKRIIDIITLLEKHRVREVITFLKEYSDWKVKAFKNLVLIDKTNSRIDQYVGALFRLQMAIEILEEGEEVLKIERRTQQGPIESCII